jgi:hypothetical protein
MKKLASLAVGLVCLLPLLTAVHTGHPESDSRSRAHRPDRGSVSTDSETQVVEVEHHGVVLGTGDQAVITEQGHTVTVIRAPTEPHKFAPAD